MTTRLFGVVVFVALSVACGVPEQRVRQLQVEAFTNGKKLGTEIAEARCATEKETLKAEFQAELEETKDMAWYAGASAGATGAAIAGLLLIAIASLAGVAVYQRNALRKSARPVANWSERAPPASVTEGV